MSKLKPEIIAVLTEKTGNKESTIRVDISKLRQKYASLPINTVAHIYAMEHGTSVLQKLSKEEKEKLPNLDIEKHTKIIQKNTQAKRKDKLIEFINYETPNRFIKAHIIETNKAYTYGCYTAAFILCRKIIENLLTDIIRKKYPSEPELYFDTSKGRTKEFSEILANLEHHSIDFGSDKKLVSRIVQRSIRFKDDANDKTHSWYHIVKSKKELDETDIQDIIAMIIILERRW